MSYRTMILVCEKASFRFSKSVRVVIVDREIWGYILDLKMLIEVSGGDIVYIYRVEEYFIRLQP